ncbi:MAG: 3'-5' exonuclease, partial [Promethearchaeota archaeon]
MPSSKKSDKERNPDQKQKSLISFVDDKPKVVKGTNEQDLLEEKIIEKDDIEEEEILIEESQLKSIPQKLFFKGNPEPFGLKKGNIKLEKVLRESVSSKYIRFLIKKGELIQNLERGLLLDVDYDGGQNKAYCKFYDLDSDEIKIWIDTTGHEPYCLSKEPISELKSLYYEERINEHVIQKKITEYDGFKRFEEIKRYDLINDKEIEISKVYGKTPTNIGGSGLNIKNILGKNNIKAWEADIRYHLNYIYDIQLIPGLIYKIKNGKIEKISFEEDSEESKKMANELRNVFKDESPEIQEFSEKFLNIFLTPIPDVKRLAMDIEVNLGPEDFIIPDPQLAKQEIISVSFASNDGLKLVYVLEREGFSYRKVHKDFPSDAQLFYFKDEKELIKETFRILWEYPVVITFNGDNFDLNYMSHRADKLKIDRDLNPIHVKRGYGLLSKSDCDLRKGVHVDLFNFFFNRSISGYAFGGAYENASLNAISAALLGRKKYEHEEEIYQMEYDILTWYNLKDSILTLELTQFNNSLVWNLIILLCRITKLPIHEMVRRQISTWIQSIFYFEHRRKQYLIPRRSEISELKKGGELMSKFDEEKFLGAYVVPPVPGIHYNVVVMDFASLYPSII